MIFALPRSRAVPVPAAAEVSAAMVGSELTQTIGVPAMVLPEASFAAAVKANGSPTTSERVLGVALPRLVRFAEPGKDFDDGVEIKIRERALNPTFPEGAFALAPPSGYKVELAACGAPN